MAETREVMNLGGVVICDLCSGDFTLSEAKGGMLFGSKGVCPTCLPGFEASVKKYGEEEYIKARANEGETFRDFVYRMRGNDPAGKVVIRTFSTMQEMFDAIFGEQTAAGPDWKGLPSPLCRIGGCWECAMGSPIYLPCNKDAKHIVRWPGRSDPPVPMCEACADHNVKNRGGEIVAPFDKEIWEG